ncbi:Dual specificity protein phosphatase CDC14AB [Merluccius polli]|uniref:Dual specificity protein phosphatase CDC14AB n=1 Tax=Merluccius polli TaxID=89951 RepID=A0AA47MPB8_MERPO|nr:Dual specificity protein phosphatase CDC14AB [Merluccius polli]
MSFLRRVAGLSLRDRVRSLVIREELGVDPLLLRVERSQMRWLGHLVRMPPGRLPGEVFRARPTGRRPRGRPRTRWRDYGALWALGEQSSQKATRDERADLVGRTESRLISCMDDLTLSPSHSMTDRPMEKDLRETAACVTQGDELRALKGRRTARPPGALRTLEMKIHNTPAAQPLSIAANSRLASSLGDLYGSEMEEPTPTYSPPLPLSSPRSPVSPLSPLSPAPWSPRGPRVPPQDTSQYVNSPGGPTVKVPPGPQVPYTPQGAYSGLKGPYSNLKGPYSGLKAASGRYLSHSIPVSVHGNIITTIIRLLSQLA